MKCSASEQSGFSLLEIVVALGLLTLVLGLTSPVLNNLLNSTGRSSAASSAQASARAALSMIQQDLEIALGNRPAGDFDSTTAGSSVALSAALADPVPSRHDIVRAGRTSIGFYADVIRTNVNSAATGPEYVDWSLEQDQPTCGASIPNWCVVRTVWNTDRSTNFMSEVVTSGQGVAPTDQFCAPGVTNATATPPQTRLFCFRRSVDQGAAPGQATSNQNLNPLNYIWNNPARSNRCTQVWSDPPTPIGVIPPTQLATSEFVAATRNSVDPPYRFHAFLDTITSVGIVIPSAGRQGGLDERTIEYAEVSIQSRQSPMYQTAIMCGSG
jgi:type II secretory pathway pseudopilin PulG